MRCEFAATSILTVFALCSVGQLDRFMLNLQTKLVILGGAIDGDIGLCLLMLVHTMSISMAFLRPCAAALSCSRQAVA